jgi:Fur family ferric uptake transcriptional regulator
MTEARRVAPLDFADLDDVARSLREAGHRLTTPARLVLEALFAADAALTAEQIAAGPDGATRLELTSVYRNLERLQALGVVSHLHVGHGPGLYVLTRGGEREYLVCEGCGVVRTVAKGDLDGVRDVAQDRFGFRPDFSHFPAHGLCAACDAAEERPGPAGHHHHAHG